MKCMTIKLHDQFKSRQVVFFFFLSWIPPEFPVMGKNGNVGPGKQLNTQAEY